MLVVSSFKCTSRSWESSRQGPGATAGLVCASTYMVLKLLPPAALTHLTQNRYLVSARKPFTGNPTAARGAFRAQLVVFTVHVLPGCRVSGGADRTDTTVDTPALLELELLELLLELSSLLLLLPPTVDSPPSPPPAESPSSVPPPNSSPSPLPPPLSPSSLSSSLFLSLSGFWSNRDNSSSSSASSAFSSSSSFASATLTNESRRTTSLL
mmetsp:Transcript_18271/g.36096  ORF Transcript_18271/g.36096 Transcript_18271/m.36096 type:complete len:211 (-) Transcript_18271:125-757(-)